MTGEIKLDKAEGMKKYSTPSFVSRVNKNVTKKKDAKVYCT